MISSLHRLQQAIRQLQSARDEIVIQEAVREAIRIVDSAMDEAASAYRQYQQIDIVQLAFQQYHRRFTLLVDMVYRQTFKKNGNHISLLFNHLTSITKQQEHIYFHLLDLSAHLPDYEQQDLQGEVKERLKPIRLQLQQKGISDTYLSEINFAMDSLFDPNKLPQVSYHHRYYLPSLLNALEALSIDQRQKNWQQRFMQIMINYNFNYMGLFNRWYEQQDQLLASAISKEESSAYFLKSKNSLRHYHPLSGMAYDPQNSTLLHHMKQYLTAQKHDFKQAQREAAMAHPSALRTNLSSLEMTVDFHYKYKFGYYPHPTKREAAKGYAQAHRSKTGQHISAHTLEKLDKKELEAAATKMRSKLLKIAQQIKEDFDL